jgi:hypothetical protein
VTSRLWLVVSTIIGLALAYASCAGVSLLAPPGSMIRLVANPTFVPSNGGVSVISAIVIEPAGTPVPDGTVVQFFTDLGRIDSEGKTKGGVARVNFIADSRSGEAHILALSGGPAPAAPSSTTPTTTAPPARTGFAATGSCSGSGTGEGSAEICVTVGNANVSAILVRADPARIAGSSNSTRIVATVYDTDGNPIANVPVHFDLCGSGSTGDSCSSPNGTESLASGGAPVFTNNNGEAEDVLRTRSTLTTEATVRARVAAGGGFVSGTVTVPIL